MYYTNMSIRTKIENGKQRVNSSKKQIEFENTMKGFKKTSIHIIEKEVEKRERLLQTYIVVFGLLLAYGQDNLLQKYLMGWFVPFLLASMLYYSSLTTSLPTLLGIIKHTIDGNIRFINLLAIFSSCVLSYVIYILFTKVAFPLGAFHFLSGILLLTYVLYLPLRINRSMFEEV